MLGDLELAGQVTVNLPRGELVNKNMYTLE